MREKEFYQQQVKLLNEKIQKENEKQVLFTQTNIIILIIILSSS